MNVFCFSKFVNEIKLKKKHEIVTFIDKNCNLKAVFRQCFSNLMIVFYTALKTESFFNCYPLIAILVQSCIKVGILRFHYRKNSFFNAHVRFNAVLTWLISNSISICTYVQKCKASNKWYVPTNWEPYSHSSKPKGAK